MAPLCLPLRCMALILILLSYYNTIGILLIRIQQKYFIPCPPEYARSETPQASRKGITKLGLV